MATEARSTTDLVTESIKKASEGLENMRSLGRAGDVPGDMLGRVNRYVEDATAVGNLWAPLFQKVGLFVQIVDALADVGYHKFPQFVNPSSGAVFLFSDPSIREYCMGCALAAAEGPHKCIFIVYFFDRLCRR
jgi:hypothetical protein